MKIPFESYKVVFSDFLHSFLEYHSDAFGCYYPKLNGFELCIVDQDGSICQNDSLYSELDKHLESYGIVRHDKIFKIKGGKSYE